MKLIRYAFTPLRRSVRPRPRRGFGARRGRRGRAAAAPGHRLRKPRTAVRALPPPPAAMHPDDGPAPHVGERQSPLARRTRSGRTLPPDAARGNRGVLRRGRNRAGPLLEPRLPGRAGRSLPPPDRPFAAIRTADRRAYARRLARNRRHHARIPRPGPSGAFSTPIPTESKPIAN